MFLILAAHAVLLGVSPPSPVPTPLPSSTACDLPLALHTRWVYEGTVEWTVANSAVVQATPVRWETEVVNLVLTSQGCAAVVRGFPDDLAWWEPGDLPRLSLLICKKGRLFREDVDTQAEALDLARRRLEAPDWPDSDWTPHLDLPLAVGKSWDCPSSDWNDRTWYCWSVRHVRNEVLQVQGVPSQPEVQIFTLMYRTNPDLELIDFAPGVGIVRYRYQHNGTVASADVHLLALETPSAGSAKVE